MSEASRLRLLEKLDVGNGSASADSDGESDLRSWDGDVTAKLFERSRIRALAGLLLTSPLAIPIPSRAEP